MLRFSQQQGKGPRDWLVQRLTALIILAYLIYLVGYCLLVNPLNYAVWRHLFSQRGMQLLTLLSFSALLWHAWLGIWTITTDYLSSKIARRAWQWLVFITLCSSLIIGIWPFWGLVA